jgi:hypothetical protein
MSALPLVSPDRLPLRHDHLGSHNAIVIKLDVAFNADSHFVQPVNPVAITNFVKPYPAANASLVAVKLATRGIVHTDLGAKLVEISEIRFITSKHLIRCFTIKCVD